MKKIATILLISILLFSMSNFVLAGDLSLTSNEQLFVLQTPSPDPAD
ncbi:hypothetical protein [Anoxybacter fermentans]|nr:hypothetical protein [Anoxybacter fermentans]